MVLKFFQFFYYFFRNSLGRVEYERHSGVKLFSLFLSLSHPVLAGNNVGKRFFNFFNFFATYIGIFLYESSLNGIREVNFFFFLFLGLSHLVLAKNKIGNRFFFNFFNFFAIFFGIFLPRSSMNGIRK